MKRTRIIIMGAAGRDFHNFNCCFRNDPTVRVVAFTASQIPFISKRIYPPSLAGKLYPHGIPIRPEEELPDLIRRERVEQVIFAYSDLPHLELMHIASRILACGADFRLLGPAATMLQCRRPVISICAVRTGCGKSQVTRYFCDILREAGRQPVVVRHPMPYGDLARQKVERFAAAADLDRYDCTIEEREEFEQLLEHGAVVYAGVDYHKILRQAEKEAEIIIWDGGNNDFPFFRPDFEIVLVDPLRPGHETSWYPGEINLRRAGLVIINKVNAAKADDIAAVEKAVRIANPTTMIIHTASLVTVAEPSQIEGKRVLVVEDGPTVTHGSMSSGAGLAAAIQYNAAAVIDPRPYLHGSLLTTFQRYPHIGPVLPAMGYSLEQVNDLAQTIAAVPCDLVLTATPIDLARLVQVPQPIVRVDYGIAEQSDAPLRREFLRFINNAAKPHHR